MILSRLGLACDQSGIVKLDSLLPNFDPSVQLFSQEVSLGALYISERSARREYT